MQELGEKPRLSRLDEAAEYELYRTFVITSLQTSEYVFHEWHQGDLESIHHMVNSKK